MSWSESGKEQWIYSLREKFKHDDSEAMYSIVSTDAQRSRTSNSFHSYCSPKVLQLSFKPPQEGTTQGDPLAMRLQCCGEGRRII